MVDNNSDFSEDIVTIWRWSKTETCRSFFRWFLINFNLWRWSCACVGIDNWVIKYVYLIFSVILPEISLILRIIQWGKGKGKAVPLQAWKGPDGSRNYELIYQLNAIEFLLCTFGSTCFGLTRPSSGAMDVKFLYIYSIWCPVSCKNE